MVIVALVIGILALLVGVMALPAVFQMIWGRPKISLDLGVDNMGGEGTVLECKIWNEPITNKLLKVIHVRRMLAEDVTALFEIREAGSGKVLFPGHMPKIRDFSGRYAQRISLPCSPINASFGIVFKKGNEPVKLFKEDSNLTFGVGRYIVSIGVIVDYEGVKREAVFEVSENAPYLYWSD